MGLDGIFVIGYGNELRGDDGAGRQAARRLREHGIEALETHQLAPELAEQIRSARAVFFLDAGANLAPGEVAINPVNDGKSAMDHYATPGALLRLAREAYGARPDAWLVSLGGASFDVGGALSDAAWRAITKSVQIVLERAVS